jgi:hypothetical protein
MNILKNNNLYRKKDMAGTVKRLNAVKNRTLTGKIIIQAELRETSLIPPAKLGECFPAVAAEEELLKVAK